MQFWWVNHSQTSSQEIGGSYIWSPQRERNGARSQYYDYMRECRPGDRVISFAKQFISYLGVVSGNPFAAQKPIEFGDVGNNWDDHGWLVPVSWAEVEEPFRVKTYVSEIVDLLPEKYSPIQRNGNGNQKAYLSRVRMEIFDWAVQKSNSSSLIINSASAEFDSHEIIKNHERKIEEYIRRRIDISETEVERVIAARKGQGFFRRGVLEVETACRVTGLNDPRLLVASHIKPWRLCKNGDERLDRHNGLMLTPTIDRLFDIGLISFTRDGKLMISASLSADVLSSLSLDRAREKGVGSFSAEQAKYLAFHNEDVFLQ